jgi:uncharacterized protein Yka (UPF0111/DUF47 family)
MKILDRIFEGGTEYDVFDRSKRVIDHAISANRILTKIINGSNSIDAIHEIEHASDREIFEIVNSITSGAVSPNLIDDMIQFVDREDDIVDLIFNLSRAIVRYRKTGKDMDRFTKTKLLAHANLTTSALELLRKMLEKETLDEAGELRKKVENVEKAGDAFKDALLDYAYEAKVDFKAFYYIQDVAYLSDDILDGCEDTSDMIVSIMRSILT